MSAFYKLSGGGNDFLALTEPASLPSAERVRAWCRRGVSLGADGLFVIERDGGAVRMHHFNSDGGPSELCLNGTRCAARLAFHLDWAAERVEIRTDSGAVHAQQLGDDRVALEVDAPAADADQISLGVGGRRVTGTFVRVGVPHFVLMWDEGLAAAPVASLGADLRAHPHFGAEGTNVDFVRFPAPDRLEIRTFERGVESETLACGTGVLAAAAAGLALGTARVPLTALTAGGAELTVGKVAADTWSLIGDARILAEGTLLAGADRLMTPPEWT